MNLPTFGINGSKFETLESRVMLTGAFPSAAQNAIIYDTHGNLDVAYYDTAAHNLKFVQQTPAGVWLPGDDRRIEFRCRPVCDDRPQ